MNPASFTKVILGLAIALGAAELDMNARSLVDGRKSLVFDGSSARLVLDLAGGSLVDFHFPEPAAQPISVE
jgi:hypothetical protein